MFYDGEVVVNLVDIMQNTKAMSLSHVDCLLNVLFFFQLGVDILGL